MAGKTLDRRSFLVSGGAAAVGIASGGCGVATVNPVEAGYQRAREYDRLEKLLGATDKFRYHEDYERLGPWSGHSMATVRHVDMQLREYLRTMLVAGAAKDLGTEDPRMQGIIERTAVDIDASVLGSLSWAQSIADGDNPAKLASLRANPRQPMEVCEIFDRLSTRAGTPQSSRNRLRRAASQLSWRFERQDPGMVMAEFVERSTRLLARQASAPEATEAPVMPAPERFGDPTVAPAVEPAPAGDPTVAPAPSDGALPSALTTPEAAPVDPPNIQDIVGEWMTFEIRGEVRQTHFVKALRPDGAILISPGGKRLKVPFAEIISVEVPGWTTDERARAHRTRVAGGAMLGTGIPLIILGAALAPFTLGIGAVPITPGIGLLVSGAVFLARVPRVS